MTFESTYAPLFIAMIIGVAALVTFFAYRKSAFDKPYKYVLPGLRFLTLVFIGILLLNPIIKETAIEEERPLLIWLQDESESVMQHVDSAEYQANYSTWKKQAIEQLEEKYDIVSLAFGETVHSPTEKYADQSSAIQDALSQVAQQTLGRNSAGIILATDGILNSGTRLSTRQSAIQGLHVLALGDSTQYFDVAISQVLNNRIAYTGNTTPIRVAVEAKGGTARNVSVSLKGTNENFTQVVSLNGGKAQITFEVGSDSAGTQRYEVEVGALGGERNVSNNRASTFIEFVEKKRTIHMVYQAPHPDISAFRLPLLDDEANDVRLFALSDWSIEDSKEADLLVFHSVNPTNDVEEVMQEASQSVLFITTPEEPYSNWDLAARYLRQAPSPDRTADVTPRINPSLSAFQVDEDWIERAVDFPPINGEVHSEQNSGIWEAVMLANVGSVKTNTPIVSVYTNDNQRVAWVNGEGWWRWRSYSYSQYSSHQMFDGFVQSLYRWLLTNSVGDRLEVDFPERVNQNESILFTVRPKDAAMNPLEDARVNLQITKEGQVVFDQRLTENRPGRYISNVQGLNAGDYRYKVSSQYGDEVLSETGELFVENLQLERIDTRARFGQLQGLANANGGLFGTYSTRDEWLNELMNQEAPTVLHEVVSTDSLLKKWWPYLLIALLLTAEWALRKREGQV
ncbi:MAG: hypothetical protein HWD92_08975 [Flavobacteriia bacterium]|nr:hypothetical protein [Flavobacteriia bacterium]